MTVAMYVADDHCTVAESELRAVILPDPHALSEPERLDEPCDRFPDVGVDQHRDDCRLRD
jgi:hypothetical protein